MTRAVSHWPWCFLAVAAVWLTHHQPVLAQPAALPPELGARAENLEKAGRWLEAAEIYADLSRRQPGVPAWQKRLRQCRTQEQIKNRYLDPSFQTQLLQLPIEKSLGLYGEVLTKIQTHYVEEVELARLLDAGREQLDLALQNPAFLHAVFAATPSEDALSRCRAALPSRWSELSAGSRRDAVQKVQAIALGLQQEVGSNPTAVVLEFVCAAAEALDAYSAYLGPERFALEKALAQVDVAGIGLELQVRHGLLSVASLAPDGPAEKARVRANERVLMIDGVDVSRLSVEDAALRLLGKEKTKVTLAVQGVLDTFPRQVEITRQRFSTPSVDHVRMVDPDTGIGYLHLGVFHAATLEEVDLALGRLMLQGMRALILDLRGNPGGSFDAAVQVADRFLADGVIASTRGRTSDSTAIFRTQDERHLPLPLVLLIDGETASAAELVAGAIRDHRRGTLVGQRTSGKGSVQYVYPLKTVPSGLRLTAARYYSPLDVPFADNPVVPDIIVDELDPMDTMESMMSMMQLQERQFETALREARALLMRN